MKKLKIIFVLAIVPISFFVVKAVGQQKILNQKADVGQEIFQSIQKNRFNPADGNSELKAQNFISTSTGYLTNIFCGEEVALTARLALVRFLNNNNKIYELNVDSHWSVASITKLITAVVAGEKIDAEQKITFTDQMFTDENDMANFKAGETFKSIDLVKAMLMLSSNNAAEALAQSFSLEDFINLMNEKAKELNLSETRFFDSTGLSAKNQSTPNDIFKIINYLYQSHPEILKITAKKNDYILELNSKTKLFLSNINQFAGQTDFDGGKSGFTDEAQGNLVSIFSVKKEPIVIIILGSQDRFGDTKKLLECVQNSENQEEILETDIY